MSEIDVAKLDALATWMRSRGAVRLSLHGFLELELGPEPLPPSPVRSVAQSEPPPSDGDTLARASRQVAKMRSLALAATGRVVTGREE